MNLLSIFSVEALDARLVPSDKQKAAKVCQRAGPKRWNTREFYIYAVVFAIAVPLMFKAAIDASSSTNPNYLKYKHLLQPGVLGLEVDNSDEQYSGFRDNLPYLFVALALHTALRRLSIERLKFDIGFSLLYLVVIHGISVFKILAILGVNFQISRVPNAYLTTWVFGMGILFANELCEGYPMELLGLGWLDKYSGLMPRWDITFNFTMLRMISFNVDYYRALSNGIEKEVVGEERQRIETPHAVPDYNFRNYLAYCIYAPLYNAGPILTFNDFLSQSRKPLPTLTNRRIAVYAARFLFCLLTMEFILYFTNVVAISQTKAWEGDTPFQISMIALFNLCVIWLKLLLIWRFFRLWALVDHIDPPENMVRCVANNYSAMSFWRAWHRSYYKWTIRYIYVPLGGAKHPIRNSLLVFTFVAVWHDIKLYLLFWGWLVVLFIIPEIAATAVFKPFRDRPWFRHLCAAGAVLNIWMMMIANLIGFCVHLDGIKIMLRDMVSTADGVKYIIVSTCCLFVGAQAMFEFREREKRQGIDMRC